MNQTITVENVDIKLLKEQQKFLLENFKHGEHNEVDGLVNIIDAMIDSAEGF